MEQAEAIYREILREEPEHAGAWHLLGVVFYGRKYHCGVLEHIEKNMHRQFARGIVGSETVIAGS